jgi:hypothetical protein
LEEFKRALFASHRESLSKPGPALEALPSTGDIDYSHIVARLVDIRLILLEARNMGLDELPEVRSSAEKESEKIRIEILLQQHVENVGVEESEVDVLYWEQVREWKIQSALFRNETAARRVAAELQEGADFETVMKKAAAEGVADVETDGQYLKNAELMPAVARLVASMDVGAISPLVPVGLKGYILFQLQGMRDPEAIDEEAWKAAEREALNRKRVQAARAFYEGLRQSSARVDMVLLDSLDYESKNPGVEALRQDRRVLAEIDGQEPIRVADLTGTLDNKFFHGFQQAIASRRVNSEKADQLEQMLEKRILLHEAQRQGIEKTDEYRYRLQEYEDALLFGVFVDRVIAPDIRLEVGDLKQYYNDNRDQFTAPRMIRMRSLVFRQKGLAVDTVDKLARGTDFDWMAAHAEGMADPNAPGLLRFDEKLVTQQGLPPRLQKAVAGSRTGDYRLYSDDEKGYHYVLRIEQVVDPGPEPFAEVRREIAEEMYEKKVKESLEYWTGELRRHYPVEIYLTQPN